MKAIILAAGKGTRLRPLTDKYPKPLLEVGGLSTLQRTVKNLETLQIDEIIVVVSFNSKLVEKSLQRISCNVPIRTIDQGTPKGTGHALQIAFENLDQDAIVINGDVLYDNNDLKKIYETFAKHSPNVVMLGHNVENPENYGLLQTENGLLVKLLEKPKERYSPHMGNLINAGIYVLKKNVFKLFQEIPESKREEFELTWVLEKLATEHQVMVVKTEGYWYDIGHPWDMLEANSTLLNEEKDSFKHEGTIEQGAYLHGQVHVGKNARIRSGAYIEGPVFIDEGADIGPNCYIRPATYVGKNVRVGNACEIKNSIILENTHVGHLSYVGDSILGHGSNLGAGTKTANLRHDGADIKVTIKGTRVSSGRRKLGVIMGDNVKTGINVSLFPGVVISSNAKIYPGAIVDRDIV